MPAPAVIPALMVYNMVAVVKTTAVYLKLLLMSSYLRLVMSWLRLIRDVSLRNALYMTSVLYILTITIPWLEASRVNYVGRFV